MHDQAARVRAVRLAICACSVAIVVGSLGPWKTLFDITTSGLGRDGSVGDGAFTLVLGALAGIATVLRVFQPERRRWLDWAAVVLLGLVCLIAVYDWFDVQSLRSDTGDFLKIGWGLHLTAAASVAGVLLSIAAIVLGFGRKSGAAEVGEESVAVQGNPEDPTWMTASTGTEIT